MEKSSQTGVKKITQGGYYKKSTEKKLELYLKKLDNEHKNNGVNGKHNTTNR